MTKGIIYGIGVGPGDPSLLTVRAVEVLKSVRAVIVPRAAEDRDSLALSIARPHLPATCEVIEMVFPMTEGREILWEAWKSAAETMLARAKAGQSVAFLTLGDAMLYSTWSYVLRLLNELAAGAEIVTVPGITAMSACAAAAGTPLAEGRAPLLVWPDAPPEDAASLLEIAPNIVFMKASRHLAALAEMPEAEAVAVRRCTQKEEAVTRDLAAWAGDKEYFTTVLMRKKEKS